MKMHNEYAEYEQLAELIAKKEKVAQDYKLREPISMATEWANTTVFAMKQATDTLVDHKRDVSKAMSDVAQRQLQIMKEHNGVPENHAEFDELNFIANELLAYANRLEWYINDTIKIRYNIEDNAVKIFIAREV